MAFGVKIATYSSGEAWKKSRTAARACSTRSVIAVEVRVERMGVAEDAVAQQRGVLLDLRAGVEPGAGVVEVDVPAFVETGELGAPELGEQRVARRPGRVLQLAHGSFLARSGGGCNGDRACGRHGAKKRLGFVSISIVSMCACVDAGVEQSGAGS